MIPLWYSAHPYRRRRPRPCWVLRRRMCTRSSGRPETGFPSTALPVKPWAPPTKAKRTLTLRSAAPSRPPTRCFTPARRPPTSSRFLTPRTMWREASTARRWLRTAMPSRPVTNTPSGSPTSAVSSGLPSTAAPRSTVSNSMPLAARNSTAALPSPLTPMVSRAPSAAALRAR